MRTDEISLAGEFWLPAVPEKKVAGILKIADGGEITLETIGTFDRNRAERLKGTPLPRRIMGRLETKRYVTLEDCFYRSRPSVISSSVARARIHAHVAYIGVAYEEHDEITFTSFRFLVEGLDEWHAVSGFQLTHEADFKKINLSYDAPPDIHLWSDGEFSLNLCFNWTVNEALHVTISQGSTFRLKSTTPRPAGEFIKLASRIVMFLAVALDKIVALRDVAGRSPEFAYDFSSGRQEEDIGIYFQSLLFTAKKRDFRHPDSIITFEKVLSAPQNVFDAWLRICEKATPALRLFFEARSDSKQYLNARFLYLAQAVETLHRRMSPKTDAEDERLQKLAQTFLAACPEDYHDFVAKNTQRWGEPTLHTRLLAMLECYAEHFGSKRKRASLVFKIVAARNYYTHFDEDDEAEVADREDLLVLLLRLEAPFQIWILRLLGFSNEETAALAKSHRQIRHRLTYQPDAAANGVDPPSKI